MLWVCQRSLATVRKVCWKAERKQQTRAYEQLSASSNDKETNNGRTPFAIQSHPPPYPFQVVDAFPPMRSGLEYILLLPLISVKSQHRNDAESSA